MKAELNLVFNNVAENKVVAAREWAERTKFLEKKELSIKEKLLLNIIDKPLSAAEGLANGIKGIFNKSSEPTGSYFSERPFRIYFSGLFLKELEKNGESFIWNKKLQDKIHALEAKAFEQSKDYSKDPIMQRLIPV